MKEYTKNLLTIGEIARISGSSIKALRYYEKIKIFNPIYINEENNYRYYSYDQISLIHILQLCVELDIPLKALKPFVKDKDTIDYTGLVSYSKQIALSKLSRIQERLQFINHVEQEMAVFDNLQDKQASYYREFGDKLFFIRPYKKSPDEKDWYDFMNSISEYMSYDENIFSEFFLSYGSIFEYNKDVVNRYLFIEAPKKYLNEKIENTILIPKGNYLCNISSEEQIHNATEIFSDIIKDLDTFFIIESDVFTSNEPSKEIRILVK